MTTRHDTLESLCSIEGECHGTLAIIEGTKFLNVEGLFYKLHAIKEHPHSLVVQIGDIWYRWNPTTSEKQIIETLNGQNINSEQNRDTEPLLQSNSDSRCSSTDSHAPLIPRSPSKALEMTSEGALAQIREFSQNFTSLHAEDGQGRTALHIAAQKGSANLVKFLLRYLEVADARDHYFKIPLHLACEYGHAPVVMVLLQYFVDHNDVSWINARDRSQMTPLMLASSHGRLSVLRLFFRPPFQPHVDYLLRDWDGKNAMHHAAANGHAECVRFLLASIPDSDFLKEVDKNGRTALKLATQHPATKAILEDAERESLPDQSTLVLGIIAAFFIILGLFSGFIAMSFMGDDMEA